MRSAREISIIGNGTGHQRDMKILPTTFRSDGFDFELLKRDGDIALFRKTKPRLRFESLEVVVIQRHETFEIEGKLIPASEHLPRSEQWGSAGWSYRDRPSAERKFNQLISASGFDLPSAVLTLNNCREVYERGEAMPSSEQWGSKGWTFSDKTSAERKAL